MATIRGVIQIQDQMSPALRAMNNAMNICISSFENLQNVSGNAVDTASLRAAQKELQNADSVMTQVEQNINAAKNSQDNFNNSMRNGSGAADGLLGKIKGIVGAYAGILGIKAIVGASDEMAQTQARLQLMTGDLQKTKELQDQIFQSAQRSRASYTDTANAVAQLGNRARDAFSSNEEVVAFSEQLNKMFTIAGASQEEMSSATLQLTQALGSGVLRGEEFNAVFEAAPNVMQAVADYMGEPIGKLKEMAADGQITADIVKKAMFAAADETNEKFESMPMTWAQVWTQISNVVLMASQPILEAINWIANNLDLIAPIVLGVATALSILGGVMLANNIYLGISNGLKTLAVIKSVAHGAAITAEMTATTGMTAAQLSFNAALYACPLTWIILAIIAVIAVIYLAVAAVNRWKGTNISATGVVAAIFWTLGATIWNIIAFTWNRFAAFAEFFANVFNNPVYSVKALFANLAINVLDMFISMTNGVDSFATNFANSIIDGVNAAIKGLNWFIEKCNEVLGTDFGTFGTIEHTASITSSMQNAKASIQNWLGDKPSDYIEIPKMEMKDLGSAAMAGYKWGAAKEASVKEMFGGVDKTDYQSLLDAAEGANQGAGDTAKNTGAMKDALDIAEEDLKYMRDMAEVEAINRFTTAEIKVDMVNNNNVNSDMDLDGIVDHFGSKLEESLFEVAEGATYDV